MKKIFLLSMILVFSQSARAQNRFQLAYDYLNQDKIFAAEDKALASLSGQLKVGTYESDSPDCRTKITVNKDGFSIAFERTAGRQLIWDVDSLSLWDYDFKQPDKNRSVYTFNNRDDFKPSPPDKIKLTVSADGQLQVDHSVRGLKDVASCALKFRPSPALSNDDSDGNEAPSAH